MYFIFFISPIFNVFINAVSGGILIYVIPIICPLYFILWYFKFDFDNNLLNYYNLYDWIYCFGCPFDIIKGWSYSIYVINSFYFYIYCFISRNINVEFYYLIFFIFYNKSLYLSIYYILFYIYVWLYIIFPIFAIVLYALILGEFKIYEFCYILG